MPCPLRIFSQSDYLIQIVDINSHTELQTVQIQISWLLRSQLIWIYTVCKGRIYPGSAGQGLIFFCEWCLLLAHAALLAFPLLISFNFHCSPHLWWKFAISIHLTNIQERNRRLTKNYLITRAQDVVKYTKTYAAELQKQSVDAAAKVRYCRS